jgi:hypothetical protein
MAKTNEIKRLNPKGADTKYVGPEPEWKPTHRRKSCQCPGQWVSWYNYHYGKKDAKDMLCHYLEIINALRMPNNARHS